MGGRSSKAMPGAATRRGPKPNGPAVSLQIGSVRMLRPWVWIRKVAWPTQVATIASPSTRARGPRLRHRDLLGPGGPIVVAGQIAPEEAGSPAAAIVRRRREGVLAIGIEETRAVIMRAGRAAIIDAVEKRRQQRGSEAGRDEQEDEDRSQPLQHRRIIVSVASAEAASAPRVSAWLGMVHVHHQIDPPGRRIATVERIDVDDGPEHADPGVAAIADAGRMAIRAAQPGDIAALAIRAANAHRIFHRSKRQALAPPRPPRARARDRAPAPPPANRR